jgi:hypothetical protein
MPRTPPKKKTVKKKTATKARPKKASPSTEFDDWADGVKRRQRPGCHTCRQEGVRDTIQALLQSLIRKRAYKFSIFEMRELIEKRHPDADVGQRGLERHLRTCDRTLYFKARGRRDV